MRIQTVTLKYNIKQTLYLYLQRFRAAIRPSPTIHEQKFTIFFNTGLTTRYAPAIMRSIQYKPFEGREVEIPPCFREPPSLGVRYRRMLKWTFRGPCQPACLPYYTGTGRRPVIRLHRMLVRGKAGRKAKLSGTTEESSASCSVRNMRRFCFPGLGASSTTGHCFPID